MHTGKWWWSVQVRPNISYHCLLLTQLKQTLELRSPGVTVIPVIISSDKTQLTHFRSKSAYPVYMSIGNIPTDIHRKPNQRAQMLMGYILTARLKDMGNKTARRRTLANLFHACMDKILSPLKLYGQTGIAMATSDGVWHRCHPIFATFIGDYPEQSLVTCTYNGRCPKCTIPRGKFGSHETFPLHDIREAMDVYSLCDSNPTAFHAATLQANLKPTYHPFWECLPFTNIFLSITPDVLHQLLQGIVKHLVHWLSVLGGKEIDARCHRLPPNHNARHFHKGITGLSRLTGQEHKDICRILLGIIVDLPLPESRFSASLARAVWAMLDFIYISQYSVHTPESLQALDSALCQFHEDKDIFIKLGVRKHFNIPKLHSLAHYRRSITLFGATNNYNMEQTERLHIPFAKKAYQATNFKSELKQMATWNERQEAVQQCVAFMQLREGISIVPILPHPSPTLFPVLAMHPSEKGVSFDRLAGDYGALDFQDALADMIVQHNYPELSANAARRCADNTLIPFQRVSVYNKIKFANHDDAHRKIVNVIHIQPEARNQHGTINTHRFDTALVKNGSRTCIVQIRVIFELSPTMASVFLPSRPAPPAYFAYVEWFSPPSAPDPAHKMCHISRQYGNHGRRIASIIPLTDICQSAQLFPVFGTTAPRDWQGPTVLEECQTFYINSFLDKHMYKNFSTIS